MSLRPCRASFVALALALGTGAARADPPPLHVAAPSVTDRAATAKAAMALHDEAWALYEQGRYRAAIEKLEAAVRMDPQGKELVYNLALLHEKLGELDQAAVEYHRYLDMETDPKARAHTQATLRRIEGAAGERRAAEATAGPLRQPAPPPPPGPRRVSAPVIVAGSVSAAALVVGVSFGAAALLRSPGPTPRTGPGVTVADLQDAATAAHRDAVAADVSFIVTAVAAGTALVLYFVTPRAAHDRLALLRPDLAGVRF